MEKSFVILGGDQRNQYLKDYLVEDNHNVSFYDFNEVNKENFKDLIESYNFIIGPTPFFREDLNDTTLENLYKNMSPKQTFFAGAIPEYAFEKSKYYNIKSIDFLELKQLSILNAIPTAEGAIKLAIENTNFTINNSKILIIGNGNIGKVLSKYLSSFGCEIFIAARNPQDLSLIKSFGFTPIKISDIYKYIGKMDIIFNTVPVNVMSDKELLNFKNNCLYIELASKPYGLDLKKARAHKINIVEGPSLPGKIAPKTTAFYIKETIYTIISELWGN